GATVQRAHQQCGCRAGQDSSAFERMSDLAHATPGCDTFEYGTWTLVEFSVCSK
ncbi:MAG: hypothetical protein JWO52_7094, partial [Gammaproteobacteria bacterium]|nr:hypothetical protein [Gammaproteobacteria bacterium]